eukprot:6212389-Pleurochrysis_carterae.AAC.6
MGFKLSRSRRSADGRWRAVDSRAEVQTGCSLSGYYARVRFGDISIANFIYSILTERSVGLARWSCGGCPPPPSLASGTTPVGVAPPRAAS